MRPVVRRLALVCAALAGLLVLLVAALHTPPVRARALALAVSQLESRYGLVLTADRLSYNLLSGGVTLTNVRLAARDFDAQPFFTAARVRADVPLAAYAGRLILDDVEVDQGRFSVVYDADGRSNLPGSRSNRPPPAEPRSLALRGLHLADFAFHYDDTRTPLRIAATGINAALDDRNPALFEGAGGPFSSSGGVDVQWRDRRIRVEPFDARLGFDGRHVSIQNLPLGMSMGTLVLSGRLNRVLDALSLELAFDGNIDVADAAELFRPPIPLAGTSRVHGTLNGRPSEIEIVTRFDAPSLTVGTEADLTASGEVLIDRTHLSSDRIVASPQSGGQIEAALNLPYAQDGPFTLQADWDDVDARMMMRAWNLQPLPIATRTDGTARYTGGAQRRLAVEADLAAITEPGATPLAGHVTAGLDGPVWSIVHDVRAGGIAARGRVEGRLNSGAAAESTLAGPSTITVESLAAADRALTPFGIRIPEAVRGSGGAIAAEANVTGTFAAPQVTLLTTAPAFDVPGVGPASITAIVDANRQRVAAAPVRLTREGMDASGSVTLDIPARTYGGSMHASISDMRTLQSQLPETWRAEGTLAADATLGGTFDAPVVQVTFSSPEVGFAGDTFTDVEGAFAYKDRAIHLARLLARKDEGELEARGRFGLDRSYDAAVEARDLRWTRTLAGHPASVRIAGTFAGQGTFERPLGAGEFQFNLNGGPDGALITGGRVSVESFGEIARVSATIPELGAFANATVSTSDPFDYRGVVVVDGLDIARVAPLGNVAPDQLTGQLTFTAALNGAVRGEAPPEVQANLQRMNAQVAGVPLTLFSPATIVWRPGEVTVRDLTANLAAGTLNMEGTWAGRDNTTYSAYYRGEIADLMTAVRAFNVETDVVARGWLQTTIYGTNDRNDLIASFDITGGHVEPGGGVVFTNLSTSAAVNGETLTLNTLSGRVDAAKAGGTFAGKGRATIPGLDPLQATGRFELDSATFDSAGIEVKQSRPTAISVDRGLITMDDVVWEAAGSALALGGSVDVSTGSPALNLTVQGIAVLRVLSGFAPNLGVDGTASVDVGIGGTAVSPDLSGSITLNQAEVALASPRIVITELSGPIALNSNRIELRGLTGTANGGSLTIDGGFVLRGRQVADGEVYVQAVGLAVEYPRGLRSEIDALLTYDVGEAAPILRGDVRVQRSAYTAPISLAALARANSGATVRRGDGESRLEELRLNITVSTVEDLRVDNNYGRFEGGAQLRIVGTAAEPGMSGQVTLREGGQIFAVGRTFTLNRGTVSFTDLNRIRPDLDIQAVTRVANLGDVTMTLQGTPDRFEFDLTSEEDATQEEIAMALLGGGVTGANALTLLSSDLLGATGRQLGLDALRIDRGDVIRDEFREDPSAIAQDEENLVTRLTLSKRLNDNVEFTLSQNLAENGKTTFILSYYPLPNLELRGISRDDGTQGAGIRHQITFGGSPVQRANVAREAPTVSDLQLDGSVAPFTSEEITKVLRVKPGQPFDYYAWQQDIDRLTAMYVDRGFFEARVRGRRDPAGENAVVVVYTIAPGPATEIRVDGLEVPNDALAAIRQSWTRGVFDRFIVQDAEARLQQVLLSRGYVNGTVTGRMDIAADRKTLQVAVDPGPPADSRNIRFQGYRGVSRSELEAVVEQAGLGISGWIDRVGLAQTLEAFYRNEGYLAVSVEVRDPVLENGTGVLPVVIDEGARATVRDVVFTGVSAVESATVRRAADLETAVPYRLAAVDAARDRVERQYRQRGYNAVDVDATATPMDDGAGVTVTLTINEGARQVLQDVETTGATRTREGIVRRALRLRVGQPVNLEEWSLARKRLFDTNVFRSVDIQAVPLGEPVEGVQQVRALVTVEEYPPWRFRYGLQADRERDDQVDDGDSEYTFGALGELRNQNLFGRAFTGGVAARIERDFQRVNTFVQSASFLGLPLRSGLFVQGSREEVPVDGGAGFVTDVRGISFEQRWRRRRGFEITYAYRYESSHTFDPAPDPNDLFPLDVTTNVGRVTAAFLLDRRDDPVNAASGTFSSASFERSGSFLGSDASYAKFLGQQFGFWSFGRAVIASRLIGGVLKGSDVPIDRFFRTGGATTVRGYPENSLGPRDVFGIARGTDLFVFNQELRFPLYSWFSSVAFVDIGNVFDETAPFSFGDMKVGYGAGLRVNSPIGLLRLDYGIPGSRLPNSTRRINDLRSGRVYFGIGHIF